MQQPDLLCMIFILNENILTFVNDKTNINWIIFGFMLKYLLFGIDNINEFWF